MEIGRHEHKIGKTVEEKIEKLTELLKREINWSMVRAFQTKGKLLKCEICGNEDYGQHFCKPCIHQTWCCECCILLGIPNYAISIYVI